MRRASLRSSIRGLLGVASILTLMASAGRSEEPAVSDAARASLPPHALLRIGTDLLRTPGNIRSFALSPGGRLVAAGDLRAPSPRITIFDVRTGRRVKQLVAPGNRPGGWVETVAFSPDGTKLLWGEESGEVALWDLSTDRLLFRQKLHQEQRQRTWCSRPTAACSPAAARMGSFTSGASRSPRRPCAISRCGRLAHLAFTPDGRRLVAGGHRSAR